MNLIKILLFTFGFSQIINLTESNSISSKLSFFDIPNELYLIKTENIKFKQDIDTNINTNIYRILNKQELISNNDIVTIKYYSSNPSNNDWIGAYVLNELNTSIQSTVPVKYGFCNKSTNYLESGYGSLKFNFTNLSRYIVLLFYEWSK